VKIRGTTISGNAALTTLGNSIAVLGVYSYILKVASMRVGKHYNQYEHSPENIANILLSGDDVLLFVDSRYTDVVDQTMEELFYHTRKDDVVHGIGWAVTCDKVDPRCVPFLSKFFFRNENNEYNAVRSIDDLVLKSNMYTGKNRTLMADPESHQALVALSQKQELGNSYLCYIADARQKLSNGHFFKLIPEPEKAYAMYTMFETKQIFPDNDFLFNYFQQQEFDQHFFTTNILPQLGHNILLDFGKINRGKRNKITINEQKTQTSQGRTETFQTKICTRKDTSTIKRRNSNGLGLNDNSQKRPRNNRFTIRGRHERYTDAYKHFQRSVNVITNI